MDQRQVRPKGTLEEVKVQASEALEQTGGRPFILGPGCINVHLTASDENLMGMKEAAAA